MHKSNNQTLKNNEQGIVSIVLTVFVLIVLSLVVVAFSQSTRRNQRQSLDQQLSSQAFYAAESGVNQLISKLVSDSGSTIARESTSCDPTVINKFLDNNLADGGQNAFGVSCLLYDAHPYQIKWSAIDTVQGEVVSLHTDNGALNKLKLTWTRSEGGQGDYSGCAGTGSYQTPPATVADYSTDCDAGMLRIQLIPYEAGFGREALYDNSYTVFLRPVNGLPQAAAQTAYQKHSDGPDTQGRIVPAYCAPTGRCEVVINGVPSGGSVFMQIRSMYYANAVDVSGQTALNNDLRFDQAQVMVDVTGKAADVTKRIQVRKALYERYAMPAFVADAMQGVCKKIGVRPATGSDPAYATNAECDSVTAPSPTPTPSD